MIVSKKFSFDAAHYLPYYEGKCRNMHGHHWVVEVGIEGVVNPETGMVIDFSDLKLLLEPLKDWLDHKVLNEVILNPTAENIAERIFTWILESMPDLLTDALHLKYVRVWETDDSMAEYSGDIIGGI